MRKYIVNRRSFCLSCCFLLVVALMGIPFVVQAEDIAQVYELFHKHVAACEVTGYETRSAESSNGPSIIETDTCNDCGATHHKYRFTASCSCGKTWSRTGHACVNSPYGKYQGSCSNYSKVNTDTSHSHPVTKYGCGLTGESVIGTIKVYKDTVQPTQSVTMWATSEGTLDDVVLRWSDVEEGTEITVEENGVYSLGIAYSENGISYMHNTEVEVSNIDKEPPTVGEIQADVTEYTSGDIILSVEAEDTMGLPEAYVSWNGGEYTPENAFTISENGNYEVVIRDIAGNAVVRNITIENIDKSAPEIIQITHKPTPWYEGSCTLYVEAKDIGNGNEGSGLAREAYSYDGGITWTENSFYKVTGPQKISVSVRDAVGNIITAEVEFVYDKKPVKEKHDSDDDHDKKETDSESENSGTEVTVEMPQMQEMTSEEMSEKVEVSDEMLPEMREEIWEEDMEEESAAYEPVSESDKETVSVITPEYMADKPEQFAQIRENKSAVSRKTAITIATIILGLTGLGALMLIAYIMFGMGKVYEMDEKGKEKFIGSVRIRFDKKGIWILLKQKILLKTKSRNLRLRLPKFVVEKYKNQPIRIVAGKTIVEKYVEEMIDFNIRM